MVDLIKLENSTHPARFGQAGALLQTELDTSHVLFNRASGSTIRVSDPFPGDRTGRCELL